MKNTKCRVDFRYNVKWTFSRHNIDPAPSFSSALMYNSYNFCMLRITVFIRIIAQPRISAHLEQAPILKPDKANQRPASNKRPPPFRLPPTQTQIRDNKRPSRRQSFPQSILQKPCFVTSSLFVITMQNKHTTLPENDENLTSAHSQGTKI